MCRLHLHISDTDSASKSQYSFRAGRLTVDAMYRLRDIFQTANEQTNKLYVGMLMLGLRNALIEDNLLHFKLLLKRIYE